ncbi:ABC transporter permease (plasmid) [Agrobacterium leguminum]|uniref:Oligopeptide ABC transporter (Permease protein) n=1 Tax=Agrobacterium deltaense NCPPB 1641 TaxID=1183425 RepID=A0A1S7U9Y7_9HYPH|nr:MULTISPECIES: ABC transporter permease [Agrobacterium]WFS69628.1 ABC transporter permease [Agrobacterium leguminum]CVI63615.1 putative oligopeptide ABC transporter (permease protein) [Agrobacterium deltaense NCPPB 1641]
MNIQENTVDLPDWRVIAGHALANRSFLAGATITVLIAAMALISFVWSPYDITNLVVADRMKGLSAQHPFGTDHFGRDILSMIMIGARNSIAVAVVAVGIGIGVGVPLGCYAAARGGWVDEALMRFNDVVFAFPALLSAVMITAILGPAAINAIIAIGIFNVPVFARVARAGALSLWSREYILAARTAGKGRALITIEHILPNIASLLLVQGTIQFALGILAEAGLSYLGLGAQPPMPSWGRMLFDAQTRMTVAPHLAIFPGLAIVITVLGLNLLGDGLRDVLDPKLRRQR